MSKNIFVVGKFISKNAKFKAKNKIWVKLKKIKILSTDNFHFLCRKFATFRPAYFSNSRSRWLSFICNLPLDLVQIDLQYCQFFVFIEICDVIIIIHYYFFVFFLNFISAKF